MSRAAKHTRDQIEIISTALVMLAELGYVLYLSLEHVYAYVPAACRRGAGIELLYPGKQFGGKVCQ
ncbi:hypothetical protein [Legionella parisiensis]|uniref:Uncharacterized protein n=1 Tax=Legionella parisiensis TaxID=45071 RepID=A0A1E5JRE7_9GAMM|nr:hypothetical protein [Legionella parisiensis]KTD42717.1 hypothetical protein Lpar_0694 [Legionella parisiensis]OEH47085.1 hypothetical protein lpari_01860 [Legionella parisiensis]STX71604.1 Uncharacterised protein [Legionella parisiensis]